MTASAALAWGISVSMLLMASGAARAAPVTALPRLVPSEDPRWLRQLPPLRVPLDKPAERAVALARSRPEASDMGPEEAHVSLAATVPDGHGQGRALVATLAPGAGDMSPGQPMASAEAGIDTAGGAGQPEAMTRAPDDEEDEEDEEVEDAALIVVLETLAIAAGATQREAGGGDPPSAVATPSSGMLPTPATGDTAGGAANDPARVTQYRWHVQLLAGRSLDRVKEDRRVFVNRYRRLLQGLNLAITQSNYGDGRDEFYRLRVVEWTSRQPAVNWCARLRARGHQCLVTRIDRHANGSVQ